MAEILRNLLHRGKWLELLREIAPTVTRAAVVRDPAQTAGTGQFGAIQSVAPSVGVELSPINMSSAGEIERAMVAFARSSNGGVIVTASALSVVHRELLVACFAAMLVPTLLRDAPIYDSLREHTLRRERVLRQTTQKK